MTISLHKDLASPGWHSSIMTTYSVDPAFYDSYIARRLRRSGCENNLLIADAAMLSRAVEATPAAFQGAGRRYAVVPVSLSGAFHPKIHLRLGSDKARLIVGSANATAAGWCRNLEILAELDWRARDPVGVSGALIRKAYDYLLHWMDESPGEAVQYKRRLIDRASPWLRDLNLNTDALNLPDGSAIDLFCDRGGDKPSMLRQLAGAASGAKIRRLVVLSPYWDTNLNGLRELRKVLSGCPTVVVLNPEKSRFPIDALRGKDDFEFVKLAGLDVHRFPHAKVFIIETAKADHVLFGSANCSDDALGSWSGVARNAEVSVYRRLKPGAAREALGLDLSKKLRRSAITAPETQEPSAEADETAFSAGYLELVGQSLNWYPAAGIVPAGAVVRIGTTDLPVSQVASRWCAVLTMTPTGPMIARVVLKSGRVSAPLIVHDEMALRRSAPGQLDGRLRDAFERVRSGREDLLDLAQFAHVIFAPDRVPQVGRPGRRPALTRDGVPRNGVTYATSEEFRRAVSLQPATGATGHFSVDDPGLLQVLSIVMRGVGGIGRQEERDAQEADEDQALDLGDSEDGDVEAEEAESPEDEAGGAPAPIGLSAAFTNEQIERRRKGLVRAMDAFQAQLKSLQGDPSKVSNRLATQASFMIKLMVLACTLAHRRTDGDTIRLMVVYPNHPSEREYSFALRVGLMLKAMWVGQDAIANHIVIDERHQSLPDDMVAWVVLSRWAVSRAFIAGRQTPGLLGQQLGELAKSIYAATAALGPVAPELETVMFRELEGSIGATPSDTEQLLRFANGLRRAPEVLAVTAK